MTIVNASALGATNDLEIYQAYMSFDCCGIHNCLQCILRSAWIMWWLWSCVMRALFYIVDFFSSEPSTSAMQ